MKTGNSPEMHEYLSKLISFKVLIRGWLVLAILLLCAFLLGFAFVFILQGIFLGVLWFMLYWKPAFLIYTKALNIKDIEFVRFPIPWYRVIFLGIRAYLSIFIIYFGLKLLFIEGFLGQNLIYRILAH